MLQVDKILDPLGHLDEDLELCVFDDCARAYCTESPWNDPGMLQATSRFFVVSQLHFAFHIRWHNTIAEWDPKSPVVPGNQNNIIGALVH